MGELKRRSPVRFKDAAIETETEDSWRVALRYADEADGPYLVDLSHKPRWDLQDANLASFHPCDMDIPKYPGGCAIKDGVIINRMNRTQAAIWHLASGTTQLPPESAYTDVTEATVFLSLFGPHVFSITEKLTALDFLNPQKIVPFLLQGPLCHVPCQIVTMEKAKEGAGSILFTCSRGYAQDMADATLAAGIEFGLRPAGENTFHNWLQSRF